MAKNRIVEIVRRFAANGMKLLLEDPGNVRDLFTLTDVGVLERVDFKQMKPAGTSFVARDYRHVEADVVLTAPLRRKNRTSKTQVTIYILIEHQSEPDELMPLRVLEYVVQIFKAQVRQWSRTHASLAGLRLQPVLPLVLYTGTQRWDSIGSLADLIEEVEDFASVTPALRPLYVNVGTLDPAELKSRGGCFGQILRLQRQRHAALADFQALLQDVTERLEQLGEGEPIRRQELLSYLHAFLYHERAEAERPGLFEVVETSARIATHKQEIVTMQRTIAEAVKDEGLQEGLKKGLKQGELRGKREVLLQFLRHRFHKLPRGVETAVKKATEVQQVEQWLERFLDAKTLDDIGIVPP
ncbi:MAG TPA: Rpn family recombination-promoting nuclease/putative transposase [Gemmataceae bacterium]|nr:Rpn family recombination-promoting nuclease/putative transposase [Gemmataceae bacterium]